MNKNKQIKKIGLKYGFDVELYIGTRSFCKYIDKNYVCNDKVCFANVCIYTNKENFTWYEKEIYLGKSGETEKNVYDKIDLNVVEDIIKECIIENNLKKYR